MTTAQRYESAREIYKNMGVDTDKAVETLKNIHISMHCWQGDDVQGFDHEGPLSGGIQTTGNYPGKARTPEELMEDTKITSGTRVAICSASGVIMSKTGRP